MGGHLTHGSPVNFSGKWFNVVPYGLDPETETIDYDEVERLAKEHRPKMIIAGAQRLSAHHRLRALRRDRQGGRRGAHGRHGAHRRSRRHRRAPVAGARTPTSSRSTSHKTLRGPRSGFVLCKEEWATALDKAVFPGLQGGPLEHVIAAKAVAFGEALKPEFTTYIDQVVVNAKAMGAAMVECGLRLVSGGTDNHLMLVDLRPAGITGKDAENLLEEVGITTNKNAIPNDPESPFVTSGIRVGSPAMTTRGFTEGEAHTVGCLIAETVFNRDDEAKLADIKAAGRRRCSRSTRSTPSSSAPGRHAARMLAKGAAMPDAPSYPNVTVVDHPLVQHKLTILRDSDDRLQAVPRARQGARDARGLRGDARLPARRDHGARPRSPRRPRYVLAGKKVAVIPILRAGLGMVDGILELIPAARVGHIGLYRDPETLQPVEYYCKLPEDIAERDVLIVDPMLATGGSASAAVEFLRERGRPADSTCWCSSPHPRASTRS